MKRLTMGQRRGHAAIAARAAARFRVVRDASDEGCSKAEAANRAKLSVEGLNALLYRNLGSSVWPIAEHAKAATESPKP